MHANYQHGFEDDKSDSLTMLNGKGTVLSVLTDNFPCSWTWFMQPALCSFCWACNTVAVITQQSCCFPSSKQYIILLVPKEREKRKWEGGLWGTLHLTGETDEFTAVKVPRQFPLVLLAKVGWSEGKAFGSEEGRAMRNGANREVEQGLTEQGLTEQGLTAFDRNFKFWH
jgi:hypothetical protein